MRKFKVCLYIFSVILLVVSWNSLAAAGKPYAIIPLSGRDVYRILYARGRSDEIPEGRIITQGIAAVGGFALGFTKALGGTLLFDALTSNTTALSGLLGGSSSTAAKPTLTSQEICFNSRSARSLNEAEAIADAYMPMIENGHMKFDDHSDNVNSRKSRRNHRKSKRRNDHMKDYIEDYVPSGRFNTGTGSLTTPLTSSPSTTNTNTGFYINKPQFTFVGSSPMTQTSSPSATVGTTGGVTNTNTGSGSGTLTTSSTDTGTGGSINCIVIQKPA